MGRAHIGSFVQNAAPRVDSAEKAASHCSNSTSRRESVIPMEPRKEIPAFKDEDAEREFWANADSTDYIDWSKAKRITLPNFRPTLRTISLRLPNR
jgi:hypothetical protein